MPTVSAYCGIAPMKNAVRLLDVVPVLAVIGRPSDMLAAVPVPLVTTVDIAHWTCDAWAGGMPTGWPNLPFTGLPSGGTSGPTGCGGCDQAASAAAATLCAS